MKIKKTGFTLVEVMVAIVLGSLIMGVGYFFFSDSARNAAKYTLKLDLQRDADKISNALAADLKAAKSDTFVLDSDEPLQFHFERFVKGDENDQKTKLRDRTSKVSYKLEGSVLKRYADELKVKTLSYHVDNLVVSRVSSESDDEEYKEAEVKISLELKAGIPGSGNRFETLRRETSVVIKDDFYKFVNKGRTDLFALGKEESKIINEFEESAFLRDSEGSIPLEYLLEMSDSDLAELDACQNTSILTVLGETGYKGLKMAELKAPDSKVNVQKGGEFENLNKQIKKVETSGWWIFKGDNAKQLEKMKDDLRDDDNFNFKKLPEEGSKEKKPSDFCDEKIKEAEKITASLDNKMLKDGFSGCGEYDDILKQDMGALLKMDRDKLSQGEGNEKLLEDIKKAEMLKSVLDMKMTDKQITEANKKIKEDDGDNKGDDGKDGKDDKEEGPKKTPLLIESYRGKEGETEEELKQKLREELEPYVPADEFEEAFKKEWDYRQEFIKCYDNCNVDNLDSGDATDYQAANQINNLAQSKKAMCITVESSIYNKRNIQKALEMKK